MGRELTEEGGKLHGGLVRAVKKRELSTWKEFRVFKPEKEGASSKSVVDARWALTRKMVEAEKDVKARQVATGNKGPDLKDGFVETLGCGSLRSSHLQVISLGTLGKWRTWGLDIKKAFLQADCFCREVLLRAPVGRVPQAASRICKLHEPAFGMNDARAASRKTLRQ